MKKTTTLIALFLSVFGNLRAQSSEDINRVQSFIAIGSGINSNTGILGFQFEQRLTSPVSVYGSAGLGTCGYKLTAGSRYYLNGLAGSAFSLSFTRSTGVKNLEFTLDVMENNVEVSRQVSIDENPVNTVNFSWLRYWKMGRKSRFNIELGYSIPFTSPTSNYTVNTPNVVLSKPSADALGLIQPGGLTIAIGFSFGISEQYEIKTD